MLHRFAATRRWQFRSTSLSCPKIALHKSKQYEIQIYQKGRQAF